MSDFVNYETRDVLLPAGCTDLIDVLKRAHQSQPAFPKLPSGAQAEQMQTGKLGELADELTWLISESIKPSFLAILLPRSPLELRCETNAGPLHLYLAVPSGEPEKQAVIRAFFSAREQEPTLDTPGSEGWHFLRYTLPCVIGPASDLIRSFLIDVFQVPQGAPLQFLYGRQPGGVW